MAKEYDENVLVISRDLFDRLGAFQGVCLEPDRYLKAILNPANNHFLARSLAEEDPSFKQIIPYAIFRHGDRYLHYVRGGGSGEQRLASKGSIGIGGHVNDADHAEASLDEHAYSVGVRREISEELRLGGGFEESVVALINDDSNEVGQVHLGVVHLVSLDSPDVAPGEAIITELQFLSVGELTERRESLETWSQLCLDGLIGGDL
jgi:predicted NUDIX family phosphoesterase